ncbi:MAG: HD domain-containing protein [Promethearchaeota archaeon]|nr:MAG: HD domain-containing protein [Candidatus Lokiarchaeota archaeon]
MNSNEILSKVRVFAYNNSEKNDIHGFTHVERVLKLSSEIGVVLNANLPVIKIAALLHDVGRYLKKHDEVKNHAEISAEIAENFIIKNNFNIAIGDVENIFHCIRAHSFSNELEPETLEAKILSDADKLDALGAIGLYRTIGFTIKNYGGIEQVIYHLENKILRLKEMIYLDYSKQIAEKRHKIILDFYNQIK